MRIVSTLAISLLAFPLVFAACAKKQDAEAFDTLQECVDEHTMEEPLTVQNAIVVCCLDHPIAGVHPSCGNAKADCVGIVRAGLSVSYTANDIDGACTTYITQK